MSRMLPGTRALRTFEAAGRHLNFTRAADEIGLTPAAVSYQIKEIEDQLGLTLFNRTSRSIQLTPSGAVLFEAAAQAMETLERAVGRARRMARGAQQLRVSLSPRFATNWLLPRLSQFRKANPTVELTFDITDDVRDFDADDIDLAIRFGSGRYRQTRCERLFEAVIAPVASAKLLAEIGRPKTPHDLFGQTLCHVECTTEGMLWPNWRMWMAAAGIDGFDDSRCVAFTDTSHVVEAVIDGGAVGLVDLAMIRNELSEGRLVQLFDLGVSVADDYAYHLVYPENAADDPRVRSFCAWMLEEVERKDQPAAPALAASA